MMKKALFLIALAGLLAKFALQSLIPAVAAPLQIAANVAVAEQIRQATVQMAMFEHAAEAGAAEAGERGLGTVVAYGSETLIITHDHWAPLTPNLHEVEFRDANGRLLLTLDAQAFRALLVFRDGGTLVLRAPVGLQGLVAAPLGAPSAEGDTVWFARRAVAPARTTVEVVAAAVTAVNEGAAPASMRLRNLDGSTVIPGDSGGGVWMNGRLVGNLWAAGVRQDRGLLSRWFGGEDEPSDLTIAALLPLGTEGAIGVQAVADDMPGQAEEGSDGAAEMVTKEARLQAQVLAE